MANTDIDSATAQPVRSTERIAAIDILRGCALLGILLMNVQSFGLIDAKYFNPMATGATSSLGFVLWAVCHVFADSKFMAIFSLLFGAGIVLMRERALSSGRSAVWIHYRRMGWLLLFGGLHAHLLWIGDILYLYSVCGMLVYVAARLRPGWQLTIGLGMLMLGSLISIASGFSMSEMSATDIADLLRDWAPTVQQQAEELEIMRGSWLDQQPHRSEQALFMQTFVLLFWGIWRAGGLMLIGMGLYQLHVFDASRREAFYTRLAVGGVLLGTSLIGWGMYQNQLHDWQLEYSFFFGNQWNYWGSLGLALAYVCGVMLAVKRGLWPAVQARLAAVGQMALSNYLAQTILCTSLFYGHGLGWYGMLGRSQLLVVVACVWSLQLLVSRWWIDRYRFGPAEWLWRSLVYWRIQPLRKSTH